MQVSLVFSYFRWVRVNSRSDPVVVSRKFTHLINYMPEYGVPETKVGLLVGNWSGDYEGGMLPITFHLRGQYPS